MKKTLLTLIAVGASCLMAYGQGAISFRNIGSGAGGTTVNAKVFDAGGTTALSGTGFSVQLWYGAAGATEGSLTALASPILGFGTAGLAGYTSGAPTVQIPGVALGGIATLQWRVWDNMAGTVTSYGQALSSGARFGASNVFQSAPLGDNLNPSTIPVMAGLTSFSLVPEPSTYALLALGAGALLFRRRK
jgi:hypothetical protein